MDKKDADAVRKILARARREEAQEQKSDLNSAKIMADLRSGHLWLRDVSDKDMRACIRKYGYLDVQEAALEGAHHELTAAEQVMLVVRRILRVFVPGRLAGIPPRILAPAAIALAAIVVIAGVQYSPWKKTSARARGSGADLGERYTRLTFAALAPPPGDSSYAAPTGRLARRLPSFERQEPALMVADDSDPTALGGSDRRSLGMRRATVIVQTEDGWAEGVAIKPGQWVLTVYTAVASALQIQSAGGKAPGITVRYLRAENVPGSLTAVVYRVDPRRNVAVLRVASSSSEIVLPGVELAAETPPARGAGCSLVGATEEGTSWQLRHCTVEDRFDLPRQLSQVLRYRPFGFDEARFPPQLVESDAEVTSADLGSPWFDTGGGRLIGLTVAIGRNAKGEFTPLHLPAGELARVIDPLPPAPEPPPFDAWTAGMPSAQRTGSVLLDADGDGCKETLVLRHRSPGAPGAAPVWAETRFAALANGTNGAPCQQSGNVPRGLWGMEDHGSFAFDVFVTRRTDGLVALGYADASGIVSDIRIGSMNAGKARMRWSRTGARWTGSDAPDRDLIGPDDLGPDKLTRFKSLFRDSLTTGSDTEKKP
jgi:hypothetical protein